MWTLVTCMGGVDVDTDHMHGRSGCFTLITCIGGDGC